LALNALSNTKPINAFVATSDKVSTGGVWGEFAYVGETWKTQFIALDALELDACDLIKVGVDGKELEVLRSGEMQIERYRPIIYFENDDKKSSPDLLSYLIDKLGYDLYWHPAPIFEESNFLNNPVNHWAPKNIVSQMVLGIPSERRVEIPNLRAVGVSDWWEGRDCWFEQLIARMFELIHNIEQGNFDAARYLNEPANARSFTIDTPPISASC
jgi:hypothetical protein